MGSDIWDQQSRNDNTFGKLHCKLISSPMVFSRIQSFGSTNCVGSQLECFDMP